jgi:hypothetical protein
MTGEKLTKSFYYCGIYVKVILIRLCCLPPACATNAAAAESDATQKNTKQCFCVFCGNIHHFTAVAQLS